MPGPKSFYDSDLIARLGQLEITARRVVDGFLSGQNRSVRHGFSVEFVEHRQYNPGDDLRHLDWKVLGRQDRLMIKRFEEETNITAMILLDGSASMGYGVGGNCALRRTKFETAAFACAGLSYLLSRQRDAVGLCIFDEAPRVLMAPSARRMQVASIVAQLEGTQPRSKTDFEAVVRRAAGEVRRRSLFIVLSDLLSPLEGIERGLRFLNARGHDAIVLQVLDPDELRFPFRGNTLFRSLEDSREIQVEPRRLRERYLTALRGFLDSVEAACRHAAYDYALLDSEEPLGPALASLMAARARRRKLVRGTR